VKVIAMHRSTRWRRERRRPNVALSWGPSPREGNAGGNRKDGWWHWSHRCHLTLRGACHRAKTLSENVRPRNQLNGWLRRPALRLAELFAHGNP
jgi:hypothetical protein